MNFWCKLLIAVAVAAAIFYSGMYHQSLVDAKAHAAEIAAQNKANAEAQAELDKKAKEAERQLALERVKSASLAEQWEKERHAKNHITCALSAGSISLLKAAANK